MATKLIMLFAFFIVIVVIVMFFRPDKKVDPVVKTIATMLTLLLVAMLTVIAYIFMLNFPNSTSVQLKDILAWSWVFYLGLILTTIGYLTIGKSFRDLKNEITLYRYIKGHSFLEKYLAFFSSLLCLIAGVLFCLLMFV